MGQFSKLTNKYWGAKIPGQSIIGTIQYNPFNLPSIQLIPLKPIRLIRNINVQPFYSANTIEEVEMAML